MVAALEIPERTNEYFLSFLPTVNSPPVTHRDISASSSYRPYNDEYVSVQHNIDRPIQTEMETERSKKDKKWSIGKLFRRKKKEEESSSSQSDEGVNGRSPSKKKNKKKKRAPAVNNFDHIVIRDTRRAQSLAKPNNRDVPDDGVLSDPSAGFLNYKNKAQEMYESKDYIDLKSDTSHLGIAGFETPLKKKRKSRLKARVEALRNSMRGESSSDEDSLKSSNSSSIIRFRSEDSLMRSRDSSLNKKSRSARNERYIKRLSRDDENQLNKEAELLQQGYTKAEVEMLTRTPTSQSSGYGTCKRDPTNNMKSDQLVNESKKVSLKAESISSFPSTQSYLSSINFNAKVNNEQINYSIKYPNNSSTKESHYTNSNREGSVSNPYETPENIMYIKFPSGNVTNPSKEEKSPPVPPPRDMHRKVATPISMYYEHNHPSLADRLSNSQNITHGVPNTDFDKIMRRSQDRTISYGQNGLRRPISNSEDHIAIQNNEYLQHFKTRNEQPRRPASVSAEPNHYGMFANSTSWRRKLDEPVKKPEQVQTKQDYLYYADQSPRSRRPISVKTNQNGVQNQYLSNSQTSMVDSAYKRPRNASEFWKKIDDVERQRRHQGVFANSRSNSENTSTAELYRAFSDNNKPLTKSIQNRAESVDSYNKNKSFDVIDGAKMWKATTEYKRSSTIEPTKSVEPPIKTHVRHKSDTYVPKTYQMTSDDEKTSERRKSTNLDDALNELEAIYNSLGLGDEDLLDRAERRELMTPKFNDHFNDWNGNDDDVQLRSQPTTPLRRISRRSTLPDKLQDDMAFRRMNSFSNKDKPNHTETQSQISYMLASPVYVPYASDDDKHSERTEPDIVHDDVVYRNIKQTNNRLKTMDPQPPFGIPVGPISPAPQSDYLHAIPENKGRSRFIPKRSPDLVADDLAYRSLRKDNRHSSLFNGDDYSGCVNNNSYTEFPFTKESIANIKKKRAVRSLSANIFSIIQKEIDDAINPNKSTEKTLQKTNSNSDVMKRLRETFESNDNNHRDHFPRNKVKQRHNTVNLFVNNTYAPAHHFTKDDSFINSDETCFSKTSSCDKSKSSSPSNKSPQISKRSSKDEFQHVLSMLAQEAMDTSNKLGVALAELDKNRSKHDVSEVNNKIADSRLTFLNGLTESYNNNKSDENYQEKSQKNTPTHYTSDKNSKAQKTEDSLIEISNQLHKVEDQLKNSIDKELFKVEDDCKSVYNVVANNDDELATKEDTNLALEKIADSNIDLHAEEKSFDQDQSFQTFVKEQTVSQLQFNPLNPFLNNDERVKELNEIKAFKELKDGISDLIAGITEVNDKLFDTKKQVKTSECTATEKSVNKANTKPCQVAPLKLKNENTKRATLSIYENDYEQKKDGADSTDYNSSEELATIFKLDVSVKSVPNITNKNNEDHDKKARGDLNSPKLVKTMSQHLRRLSVDEGTSSQNNTLPSNVVPWRAKRLNHNSQNETKAEKTLLRTNSLNQPPTAIFTNIPTTVDSVFVGESPVMRPARPSLQTGIISNPHQQHPQQRHNWGYNLIAQHLNSPAPVKIDCHDK